MNNPLLDDYNQLRYKFNRQQTAETPYLGNGTAFPSSPGDGDLFFRTDQGKLYYYQLSSTSWQLIIAAGSGGGVTSLNTATGALTIAGSGGSSVSLSGTTLTITSHTQGTDTGTTSVTFQLNSGASGVKLKDSSGLAVRNAADTADANLTAAQVNASGGIVQLAGVDYLRAGTSFPVSPTTGQQFKRTDYRVWFTWDGSAWRQDTVPSWSGSFPASPITDLRVYRSDRDIEYFYDGTRWLSTTLFTALMAYSSGLAAMPLSATTAAFARAANMEEVYDIYVTKMVAVAAVNTTLDATNNWTITLNRSGFGAIGSVSTWATGRTIGTRYQNVLAINTQYNATSAINFSVDVTKNNAPGTVAVDQPNLWYRLVG